MISLIGAAVDRGVTFFDTARGRVTSRPDVIKHVADGSPGRPVSMPAKAAERMTNL